jgi:hypothetical protein
VEDGLVRFDSNGRVWVPCAVCEAKAQTVNGLCQKHLHQYYTGKLKLECPAINRLYDKKEKENDSIRYRDSKERKS